MTLIMGMAKREGIYLSADYRVTQHPSGKLVDDAAIKFLTIHYPPDKTGPKALLACTGLAFAPDGTPMGTWIRETLRGESEFIDQSMAHLRARLNRDIAPRRWLLIINVLVVAGERRFFGALSNVKFVDDKQTNTTLTSEFAYHMQEVSQDFAFANGAGATELLARGHFQLVQDQLKVQPRKVEDHMKLLASINRKVAAKEPTVSPHCHVSYVNADDSTSPTCRVFTEPGESAPIETPMLLFGIDLTGMMKQFMERVEDGSIWGSDKPMVVDKDAINEGLKRRP